jgi:putative transposase
MSAAPVGAGNLPPVGIDVGLEHFLSTSEGGHEPNPRFLKNELPELRRLSRSLSRKKKGGSNQGKTAQRLQRLHARITNCRHDHRHKVSLELVRRYGMIAVESLNITKMLGNHWFARAISDAGWAGFLETLKHKAERAGGLVVEVDCRGTSQECSGCHAEVRKSLSVRVHRCPHCGLVLQRDVNAAKNILFRALQARTGPVGANGQTAVSQEAVCFS